jgi:hypothetical protein
MAGLSKVKGSGLATGAATASLVGIDDNATSTAITIDASENVGIGTATPAYTLHIDSGSGTTTQLIKSANTTGEGRLFFGDPDAVRVGAVQYNHSGNYMTLWSNGTERVRILSTGGITFNGDTAAANALDDYEEGTWTPVIGGDSGTSGQTYSVQDGYYTKIGNTVTCNGRATLSAKGTLTGGIIITGLPFSSNGTTTYRNPGSVGYFGSLGASVVDLSINMTYGVSTITVYKLSAAGIVRETMDTTDITNTTQIDIAITYKV